jgi:hypothetical protein
LHRLVEREARGEVPLRGWREGEGAMEGQRDQEEDTRRMQEQAEGWGKSPMNYQPGRTIQDDKPMVRRAGEELAGQEGIQSRTRWWSLKVGVHRRRMEGHAS